MPKVTDDYKDEVRTRLLDAAEVCIARSGVDAFTTRDVSREADVSAGTLYTYFSGKDELILAVAERNDARGLARLMKSLPPDDRTGRGFAAGLLVDVLGDLQPADEPDLFHALRQRALRDDAVAESWLGYNRHLVTGLAPLVATAQAEGTIRADIDVEALVEAVACFADGVSARLHAGALVTEYDRIAEAFLRVVVGGAVVEDDAGRRALERDLLERFRTHISRPNETQKGMGST